MICPECQLIRKHKRASSLPINRDVLATCYDFLRHTKPFIGWNLPDPDDLKFVVTRNPTVMGYYDRGLNQIAISSRLCVRTDTLVWVMAHEMIHLHEHRAGMWGKTEHSTAFKKMAEQVCKIHGFDPGLF